MPRKVLLVGPINENFEAFLKRFKSVNAKAGPFGAVFSIGSLGNASSQAFQEFSENWDPDVCQLYVFDGHGNSIDDLDEGRSAAGASGITRMGLKGIITIAGLQVAYVTSTAQSDSKQLIQDINQADGDIDLLISIDWPANVTSLATPPTSGSPPEGSSAVAAVAQAARPRYHISTSADLFYQREPYVNPDRGAGAIATRFISLAAVANPSKAKWVHALALEPASSMSATALCTIPEQSTKSPFLLPAPPKRKAPEQAWRFAEGDAQKKQARIEIDSALSVHVKNVPFSAKEEDVEAFFSRAGTVTDVRWRESNGKKASWLHVQFEAAESVEAACKMTGQLMMGREVTVSLATAAPESSAQLNLGNAVKDCWFCLSNEQADVQLVVDVLEDAYIAMDKGPIDNTHALIVSVEHYPNTITLNSKALQEVHSLMDGLSKAYSSKGLRLVGFERYLAFHSRGGNHCHLNFIGISEDAAKRAQKVIEDAARASNFSFERVPAADPETARSSVQKVVQSNQYFQVFLPDGSRLVHTIPRSEKHPMAFGRECLAKLAGVPGRADWRKCKADSTAEEEAKTAAFREFWMPFSPNPL